MVYKTERITRKSWESAKETAIFRMATCAAVLFLKDTKLYDTQAWSDDGKYSISMLRISVKALNAPNWYSSIELALAQFCCSASDCISAQQPCAKYKMHRALRIRKGLLLTSNSSNNFIITDFRSFAVSFCQLGARWYCSISSSNALTLSCSSGCSV